MSSSEDKCEVSKDKHEDRGKNEYFREAKNSAEGRKGKRKPPLGEYIRMLKLEARRDIIFLLRAKKLRAFQKFSVNLLSNCDSTRFSSLRLLELEISPTTLVAEGSYLVLISKRGFRIINLLLYFSIPYLFLSILACSDLLGVWFSRYLGPLEN